MFSNSQSVSINISVLDVCKTQVGPATVPIPYVNIAMTSTAIPNIFNQFTCAMPDHNLITMEPSSNGNQAGSLLGVVSSFIMGTVMNALGSVKVFKTVMPATRMLDTTAQNGVLPNAVGITISPGQIKVMILC